MSTSIKILLLLLAWLLYTVLVYRGCKRELCLTCGDGAQSGIVAPPVDSAQASVKRYPIDFQWGNANPFQNDGAEDEIAALKAGLAADNILEVTGYYYEGEPKPQGFENMGFARAEQIKTLLVKAGIPADRIRVRARALDEAPGMREGYFVGYESRWLAPEKKDVVETLQELDDRIIIRFPTGSTQKVYDKTVDDYLDKLADRIKKTGETVTLTGHTDNVGDDAKNMTLGQGRADAVKQILVAKGVKPEQITTASKGETQPVTSNDTEAGRAENRRVELRLNKK